MAGLLQEISPRTIDRLLAREREVRCLKQHRRPPVHPLLYQRVPVKTAAEWDRQEVGNVQLDYVLHCGRSTAGEYLLTLSATDIATGWWEGQVQPGRSQEGHAGELGGNPPTDAIPGTGSAPGQRLALKHYAEAAHGLNEAGPLLAKGDYENERDFDLAWAHLAHVLELAARVDPEKAAGYRRRVVEIWQDQDRRYPGAYVHQRGAEAAKNLAAR